MIPISNTTDPRLAQDPSVSGPDIVARVLDGLPAPALLLDAQGRIVLANAGFVHLVGFAQSELIGRPAEQFLSGDSRVPIARALQDSRPARRSPADALPQLTVAHRDGALTVLEVSLSPLELDGRRFLLCGFESLAARSSHEELARSAALLNSAQRIAKVGSWMWDVVNDWQWWSDELYRMLQIDPRAPGRPYERFFAQVHPEDREIMLAGSARAAAGQPTEPVDVRVFLPDGRQRFIHVEGEATLDERGRCVRMQGTLQDITERRALEDRLRESEARYASTVELAAVGIAHIDHQGRFIWSNQRLRDLLGYTSGELEQLTVWQVSHPEDLHVTDTDRIRLHAGEIDTLRAEKRYLRSDGATLWVRITSAVRRGPDGALLYDVSIVEDVTARRNAEERVRYLATHDELTGLPNRALFGEFLGHAIEKARRHERQCAVVFLDLDRFKIVNDSLGHAAGDQLLKEVAERLRHSARTSDLIARLGGDEFVLLIEDVTDSSAATGVAKKVLSNLLAPVRIGKHECRVTGSIGIATYPTDGPDAPTLMRHADMAMYRAKEEGKNNYQIYSAETSPMSVENLLLESHLARALERKEFAVHYQPKVDIRTGQVRGAEALLRWWNTELGTVSPAHFIPVAEDTGLIVPIGKWVMKTACEQNMVWQRRGLRPIVMSVNLSPRQFKDPMLLDDIAEVLQRTGMAPELLELEITESMIMHNLEQAAQKAAAIKGLGVRLAIDDFGTGYSSLSQLKRFPIDTLKVDRSFIRDVEHSEDDRVITQAIISLGKALDVSVVAEGVETEAQCAFLRDNLCDEMQGYYFSKPCHPDAFAEILLAGVGRRSS